jgi:hypothetical protein
MLEAEDFWSQDFGIRGDNELVLPQYSRETQNKNTHNQAEPGGNRESARNASSALGGRCRFH